jgi:trehalose 6-phosphate phosphatase
MRDSAATGIELTCRKTGMHEHLFPSPDWALFLDVDGTLLHLAETPEAVEVSYHLRVVLARLAPTFGGAVALISGRRIEDLDRLFAPLRLPAAGLHGLEHRDARGNVRLLGEAEMLSPLRGPLREFATKHDGVLLEDKGRTLALHYRKAPHMESESRRLVAGLAGRHADSLRVIDGKMVLEIKPRLSDKGIALRSFLDESPFRGRRPVFIGDDVTDEDAFGAVNDLGGHSIRVGNGRDSQARWQLPDVNAVLGWLEALPERLERESKDDDINE